ncbi:MAG: nucleotidyltransferase domain-containing protein [Desulfobulbaceae bacterium]|nr:nucleotidyltransferase domain-containing protein [Desulfobulbaceae bacterium]MCK5405155.1 nucleotidyltransferase domain-containing protein [Desulfobulbaceae bacterium]
MAEIDALVVSNVKSFLRKLTQSGIKISKAYIFGSYAKGVAGKWSDIDVAVVSSHISNDRFEERIRLTEMAINIDNRIEPLPFNINNFVDGDPLVREIKKEGISVIA